MLLKLLKYIVAIIYEAIIRFRFRLYKHHFLGQTSFDIPIICVGNLSVGGTGKTPMVDYLCTLLENQFAVGIISRGYKRKTKGFIRLKAKHTATEVGDEPLFLKLKHPHIEIAVGEERIYAIPHLLSDAPQTQIILMDDGFQHLSVQAQLNILMTDYQQPFWSDKILPLGTLREPKDGYKRADIIIVNKCPDNISKVDMQTCILKIEALPNQKIFFAKIRYKNLYALFYNIVPKADENPYILFTGIANADSIFQYLNPKFRIFHFQFDDHHAYSIKDFEDMYAEIKTNNWITTEKDAVKLFPFKSWFESKQINVWVQPIQLEISSIDNASFDELIHQYLNYYFQTNTETN